MNNTNTENISYFVSDTKIRFLEIVAQKKGEVWDYVETGPWFKKRPIGNFYESFTKKVENLKVSGKLDDLGSILCNSACATELLIYGVLTKEMIASIDEKVAGVGGGMTPMVCIPKQSFTLSGVPLKDLSVVIVDCFSYNGFCFIDKNDKDM